MSLRSNRTAPDQSDSAANERLVFVVLCVVADLIMVWTFSLQIYLAGGFNKRSNRHPVSVIISCVPALATVAFVAVTVWITKNEINLEILQNVSSASTQAEEDTDYIVENPIDGTRAVVSMPEFETRFEPAVISEASALIPPQLAQQGFITYQGTQAVWARLLTSEDIRANFPKNCFLSNTNKRLVVREGDYLVLPFPNASEVFALKKSELEFKYTSDVDTKDGYDSSRPREFQEATPKSQAATFAQWDLKIREEGQVYHKIGQVSAKIAPEEGVLDTVVNGSVEARKAFKKGDYIVCGSRGGRYSMTPSVFSERYDDAHPTECSDRALNRAGFKSYQAIGKIWAKRLTIAEVGEYFPARRFIGRWGGLTMQIKANDLLAMPFPLGGEIYVIKAHLFKITYAHLNLQDHVPTQAEVLAKWAVHLQQTKPLRESTIVFAKPATAGPKVLPQTGSQTEEDSGDAWVIELELLTATRTRSPRTRTSGSSLSS